MPSAERQILLAPDIVARTAAQVAAQAEQRWMLRQPREVRRSFVEEVLDQDDVERSQEIWMLRQPQPVRESYLRDVLGNDPGASREMLWMLRQSDAVCQSYVRDVLLADEQEAVTSEWWAPPSG